MSDETEKLPEDPVETGYEKRDVNVGATFVVGAVVVLVIAVILVILNDFFVLKKEEMMNDVVFKPESAALRDLRAREMEILGSYRLLDATKGIYRIPISRAMELMVDEAYQAKQAGGSE